FAVRPDLALYFRVPIDVSVDRLLARRVKLKFYEAGLDMGWSTNPVESFRLFQGKVLEEYDQLVKEFGLEVIDATGSITEQQRAVRRVIARHAQTTRADTPEDEPVNACPSDRPGGVRRTGRERRDSGRPLLHPRHSVPADRRLSRPVDCDR